MIHHIAGTKTEPVEIACDSGVAGNVDRAMVEGRRATVEQDDLVAAPHKKARETPPRKPGAPRNDVTHARTYPAGAMRPPRTGGTRKTRSSLTSFPEKKESNPLMNHGFARAQDIASEGSTSNRSNAKHRDCTPRPRSITSRYRVRACNMGDVRA